MATNLGSTGLTYNTTNMKPESSEQIDALWGQNIADNVGAAYWGYNNQNANVGTRILFSPSNKPLYNISASGWDSFYVLPPPVNCYFFKKANYNTITGTFIGTLYVAGATSGYGTSYVELNGVNIHEWGTGNAGDFDEGTNMSFSYDISGLTDDVMYKIKADYTISASGAGANVTGLYEYGIFLAP